MRILGGALAVVLLVALQDLVLDELDDVGEGERLLAGATSEDVLRGHGIVLRRVGICKNGGGGGRTSFSDSSVHKYSFDLRGGWGLGTGYWAHQFWLNTRSLESLELNFCHIGSGTVAVVVATSPAPRSS